MEKRINFNSEKSRDKYFKDVLITNNLSGWNELSLKFGIPRATLSKYRIGKLTLPVNLYRVLSANFSDYNKIYFLKETSILDDNWGQIKGGIKTYSSHKEIFEKGREKPPSKEKAKQAKEAVEKFVRCDMHKNQVQTEMRQVQVSFLISILSRNTRLPKC